MHQLGGIAACSAPPVGLSVALGGAPAPLPAPRTERLTFPAASSRWTSEREEVPGWGPVPSHPIVSQPIPSRRASRRRLSAQRAEPRHGPAQGAGPAGGSAGYCGLVPLLRPPGAAPPLQPGSQRCLGARCFAWPRPSGGSQSHCSVSAPRLISTSGTAVPKAAGPALRAGGAAAGRGLGTGRDGAGPCRSLCRSVFSERRTVEWFGLEGTFKLM